MNSPEDHPIAATGEPAADRSEVSGLFPGDTGSLPFDARRVLCQLLAGPSVDAERHALLWPVLLREEPAIRARLSDLFLDLVLDRDLGVAFLRQADTGELGSPTLLRTHPLTFIDSVLLLGLRRRLAEAQAHGQRAVVEESDLHAQLSVYAPTQGTDRAGFTKKVNAAIEKMKKNSVLQPIRGSDGRHEIAPVLRLLFSAEDVQALGRVYRGLVGGQGNGAASDGAAEEDE
jgi:hypothetical protein